MLQQINAMIDYSPDTPFSTTWLSGVGELGFSVQLSPTRHKQNIHKVTNLLNSMTGVCWEEDNKSPLKILINLT